MTADYSTVCDTSGSFDCAFFCNFEDGTFLNDRGPNFIKRIWESEQPTIEQSILTEVVVGSWPFNTNKYTNWRIEMKREEVRSTKFSIY